MKKPKIKTLQKKELQTRRELLLREYQARHNSGECPSCLKKWLAKEKYKVIGNMKIKSAKAKGKRLELKVARLWRHKMKDMGIPTPGSGSGKFKGDVYNRHYTIECKNVERVSLWEWWNQARDQKHLNKPPVLFISGNHRPILAVMDIDEFLNLVKEAKYEK